MAEAQGPRMAQSTSSVHISKTLTLRAVGEIGPLPAVLQWRP